MDSSREAEDAHSTALYEVLQALYIAIISHSAKIGRKNLTRRHY
jgi:hypothetical protein